MKNADKKINVAIVGIGNCASSLVQGLAYYKIMTSPVGVMEWDIGGYTPQDINVVLGFDIDQRKVGLPVSQAIYQNPNCTRVFVSQKGVEETIKTGIVHRAPTLDGYAKEVMEKYPEAERFVESTEPELNREKIVDLLTKHEVDIVINYLPVGSQVGTEFWAYTCLSAGCNFLNCIPVFIASNDSWAKRFENHRLSVIGDDMKSQIGASIVSQMLEELAVARGHRVNCHIQRNVGGNTDFLNMEDASRVASKKVSKENVLHQAGDDTGFKHAGPSEYISYLGDIKVADIHMELNGFMGAPVKIELKLTVIDSPNSAGIVIDAIRYLKTANELGVYGAVESVCAWTQKSPPMFMPMQEALDQAKIIKHRLIEPSEPTPHLYKQ